MRRVLWLVLVGAACAGCAREEAPEVPTGALEAGDPRGAGPAGGAALRPPKTFALSYAKLWDPKGGEKFDAEAAMKAIVAQRYFAEHQTEYLATATVGTGVSLAQGGWHGVLAPAALAAVYPNVGKKMESEWADRLTAPLVSNTPLLDFSTHATGAPSARTLVFRVKPGTDDDLRARFDEYLARVEEAVKAAGVGSVAHRRGGSRTTGSLSDVRYENEAGA